MEARIKNPASYVPEALPLLMSLGKLPFGHGVPDAVLELVHQRVSQINGCAWCLDYGMRGAKEAGLGEQKLTTLAAWRESPFFSDEERAALDLAEAMTRMSDHPDPVPDPVWAEAARHYDEKALAAMVLWVATTNLYNRVNVATRQIAPSFKRA
jgi:AhpD family alkylhydroperoxidase